MSNQPSSNQIIWKNLAAQARDEANDKPVGPERDKLLKRANQLQATADIEGWLNSSELRPPAGR